MKKTRDVYLKPLNIQWDSPTGNSFTPPRCKSCDCITSIVYLDRNGFCADCLSDTDYFNEIQSEYTEKCSDLQATIDDHQDTIDKLSEIITENNTSVSTSLSTIKRLKDLAKSYKRLDDLDDTIEKYSLMENKLNSIFELLGV
jgi:hypothetical protein